jgi:uncharacterized protein YbjT (DUF2867 family)
MVATEDIARAAIEALERCDWTGVVTRELLGPRDISYAEATRLIGEQIGKPDLQYVQLPYEEMADILVQAGLSRSFRGLYVEMTRAFNEGHREGEPGANSGKHDAHAIRRFCGSTGPRRQRHVNDGTGRQGKTEVTNCN